VEQRCITLSHLRIVLVEPAGPLNVGSVARIMKNMGLEHLTLVNPQCDPAGEEALQMAVHADDILRTAQQVATLPEALQGCQRAIATTARDRTLSTVLETPRTGLPWLLEAPQVPAALIFGPEDRGLSNAELNFAQRFVRIPSSTAYPSLNLAQAVAICCYELYGGVGSEMPVPLQSQPEQTSMSDPLEAASLDTLEAYYQQLEAVLLKIGYLYPHTASSRMTKFRRLFNRAYPSPEELAMLRGILSQMEWALQTRSRSLGPQVKDAEKLL
jgi:tRNA/rRNA methyltransferase